MAILLHEVWEEPDDQGEMLPGCCLAGSDGKGFRHLMGPDARFVCTFEAGSHYEAMTIYYRIYGYGTYTTEHAWDFEPYPDEWLERQCPERRIGPASSPAISQDDQ